MRAFARIRAREARVLLTTRRYSTSFSELYRRSMDSAPLAPGDTVQGHIVGHRRPRSTSSRFHIVDFGLKTEAPFTAKEVAGSSNIGDAVSMPLLAMEDDFNEPVFDQDHRSDLPALQAERYELLTKVAASNIRILHGRFANFKPAGAGVKVLGTDAFVPRHHVVSIDRPVLGSFAPFYVMNLSTEMRTGGAPGLDVNPVVSSYGGFLFCIANLVGNDEAWEKSGGGSAKQRQAYLRLLTRLLNQKNTAVRRIFPKSADSHSHTQRRRKRRDIRQEDADHGDTAWLNDLPRGDWSSSRSVKQAGTSNIWQHINPRMRQKAELNSSIRSRQPYKSKRSGSNATGNGVAAVGLQPGDDF